MGFPIQKSSDQDLLSGFPTLIAASHVFHRLLTPRHPPYALSSLTYSLTSRAKSRYPFPYVIFKEQNCPLRSSVQPDKKPYSYVGGGERDRTDDLRLAKPALSQLSYTPENTFGITCNH